MHSYSTQMMCSGLEYEVWLSEEDEGEEGRREAWKLRWSGQRTATQPLIISLDLLHFPIFL